METTGKCQKWIDNQMHYGGVEFKCNKPAVAIDGHGRELCQKHYNQWLKKSNKSQTKK